MNVLSVLLVSFILLVVFLVVREQIGFYTKANCTVCGEACGEKGNRRFKISDGHACENCLKSLSSNVALDGSLLYASRSAQSIREDIALKAASTPEEWVKILNDRNTAKIAGSNRTKSL